MSDKNDFKVVFISELTKFILKSTDSYLKLKIKDEIHSNSEKKVEIESSKSDKEKKDLYEMIRYKIERDKNLVSDMKKQESLEKKPIKFLSKKIFKSPSPKIFEKKQALRIPLLKIQELNLPPTVRDVYPIASNQFMDLEKLNPLIRDRMVRTIESQGANQNIIVTGLMGRKPTPIKLSENEIKNLIQRFAEAAKIPFEDGFFKVAVGNLIISAIVSDISSKFIIKKI